MRSRNWLLGLAATCLAVLFGCSLLEAEDESFELLRSHIQAEVEDPDRARAMLAHLDESERQLAEFRRQLRELGVEMREINAHHETSREHIDSIFQAHNRLRARIQARVLGSLLAIRDLAEEDEWVEIVDLSVDAYRRGLVQEGFAARPGATEGEGE